METIAQVARTFAIPEGLDGELRKASIASGLSLSELVEKYVTAGLDGLYTIREADAQAAREQTPP